MEEPRGCLHDPSASSTQTQWPSLKMSEDAKTCVKYLEEGRYDSIHSEVLEGSTKEYRHSLFKMEELRGYLHEAISQTDFDVLEFLLEYCCAPMEVTNNDGLTPLYKAVYEDWVKGALFLLRHGASVSNADRNLNNRSCGYPPLVHAVVRTESESLLREVILRGADINVLDLEGQNCLAAESDIPDDLECVILEEMVKADPLRKELFPDVGKLAKGLTASQQDPRKKMLLHGAWRVTEGDFAGAFDSWKKSFQSLESDVDGSKTFENEWAGILNVNDCQILKDGGLSGNDKSNYYAFALLVIATYAPADEKLFQMREILYQISYKLDTRFAVLRHLTEVRALHKSDATLLVSMLHLEMQELSRVSEISFSLLLDSVMIASRCLSCLTSDGSFSTDRGLATRHDLPSDNPPCGMCSAMAWLSEILQRVMSIYDLRVSLSQEQLLCFSSHIKDFVCTFPWMCGENFFHYIGQAHPCGFLTASSIKILVALSAEARGTNRHENLPPHLSSDKDGNTPLHVCARLFSPEDLVEEGVLQCFLDNGAHLCIRNNQGESVRDILVSRCLLLEAELLPSLQCLAAAAFMKDANLRERVQYCGPQRIRHLLLDH